MPHSSSALCIDAGSPAWLRGALVRVPRPLRFLGVGAGGLATDLAVFTLTLTLVPNPLLARLASLAVATLLTWRLNRAVTFDRSGRHQADEALRYALVATSGQGTSYAIFAALLLSGAAALPQLALLAGAAAGAVVSYQGHRLFAFRRQRGFSEPSAAADGGRA